MKKKTTPSNASVYIELSFLALFFFMMLAPIFMVIHNHNSDSHPNITEESPIQEKNSNNTEHDATPTEPAPDIIDDAYEEGWYDGGAY